MLCVCAGSGRGRQHYLALHDAQFCFVSCGQPCYSFGCIVLALAQRGPAGAQTGHKRVCKALGAARAAEKEERRVAAAGGAAAWAAVELNGPRCGREQPQPQLVVEQQGKQLEPDGTSSPAALTGDRRGGGGSWQQLPLISAD